ncbi:molybdate transport system substrate-binding protein [Paenibacillus catalpae]|uniref:Molybdate transport system substrate-binding protein n=2 Tax=Paenibacillus catalpae TaxID=1045775 RepID=A0A1I1VK40_9BACL|nr:molybdate transport system substrate-binding protein [Paenibacillus catalpae]
MEKVWLCLVMIVVILAGCSGEKQGNEQATNDAQSQVELTVSAAASLTDALNEIQKTYEEEHPNIKLRFNFGASGALQQQIEQGAPADLFLSAATKNLQALMDKQLIAEQTNLLTNELVVVVPGDQESAVAGMADLTKASVRHLAIGIPESVPAGSYAKEALINAKLWDGVQSKAVQGKDVRQVLQYVETGNADAGFVYKTDALTSNKAKIAFTVDPAAYTAIQYPIGIVKATKHSKEAEDFYIYLQSREAFDIFVKYGFSVPSQ